MVIDASALTAILLRESDADLLTDRIEGAITRIIQPISVYETAVAVFRVSRRGMDSAEFDVRSALIKSQIEIEDIGPAEAAAALDAFARYGKGRHPAALNMGDCFSYACAKLRGMPLLYKGDDFAQTDLA